MNKLNFTEISKKINIAHIVLTIYLINMIQIIATTVIYGTDSFATNEFGVAYGILSMIAPIIIFAISYYLLKKSEKSSRTFNSVAIVLVSISFSKIIGWALSAVDLLTNLNISSLGLSLAFELISAVVIGLLLSRRKSEKTLSIFYKLFIAAQLLVFLLEVVGRSYVSTRVMPSADWLASDSIMFIISTFDSYAIFILSILFGYGYLKSKPILNRLYELLIVASVVQAAYSVACSLVASFAPANDVVAMIVGYVFAVTAFCLSITAAQNKENLIS